MNRKNIHEKYHSGVKLQKRIISSNNFTYRNTILLVNEFFAKKSEILDIGCGVGTIDFYIVSNYPNIKIKGVDISEKAIDAAVKNSSKFGFGENISYSITSFPGPVIKGKFDGILISEVLEHIPNDKIAVNKIYSMCGNESIVIASSPSITAPLYRLGMLKNFDNRVGHLRRYSAKEFKKLFENNGFKIIKFVETEGILRNFLFTNSTAGKFIRYIRGPFSDIVTIFDNLTIPIFGASNYYIVAQKK